MDVSTLLEDEDIAASRCFAECIGYAGQCEGSSGSGEACCAGNCQCDVVACERVDAWGYCYIVVSLYCYRLACEGEGAGVGGEEAVGGSGGRIAGEQELPSVGVEFEGANEGEGGRVAREGEGAGGGG